MLGTWTLRVRGMELKNWLWMTQGSLKFCLASSFTVVLLGRGFATTMRNDSYAECCQACARCAGPKIQGSAAGRDINNVVPKRTWSRLNADVLLVLSWE